MAGIIIGLIVLAAIVVLSLTTDVLDIFAPVVNSGSAVIAVAFVVGVFIYRYIRKKKAVQKPSDNKLIQGGEGENK